jgi:hypothetical protein
VKSVLSQFTVAKTHKSNLKINNDMIRLFITHAEKVLFMDAHLEFDGMVKAFMEDMFKPSELLFCRYDYNPMKRTLVLYKEEFSLLANLEEALEQGKKILCVFRSKKSMHKTLIMILDNRPNLSHVFFDGDSTAEKMKIFQSIDAYLVENHIQLIAFTSKVTVAADIQESIDVIYCFADTAGGSSARDAIQGCGRARNLTSGEIHILLGLRDRKTECLQTRACAEKEILENKTLRYDYTSVLTESTIVLHDDRFQWTPGRVCKQFAYEMAEKNTGFNLSFDRLVNGCIIKRDQGTGFDEKEMLTRAKLALVDLQQSEIKTVTTLLREQKIDPISYSDFKEAQERRRHQIASERDIMICEYLAPYFAFDEEFRDKLTWSDILTVKDEKCKKILDNAKVMQMLPAQWLSNDVMNLTYAAIPEFFMMRKPMFEKIIEVCQLAGFTGLGGTGSYSLCVANKAKILKLTDEIALLHKTRKNRGKNDPVKGLQKVLKLVGCSLAKERRCTKGVQEITYTMSHDCTLKQIEIITMGVEKSEYPKVKVELSRLLPHYKNKIADEAPIPLEWDDDDEPAAKKQCI